MGLREALAGGRALAALLGVATAIVSATVLAGWALGYAGLTTIVPGWPAMVPATATALLLASVALLLLSKWPATITLAGAWRPHVAVAQLCALLVLAIGTLRLVEIAVGADWRVSFFGARSTLPGSMSPATAVESVMLGIALLLTASRRLPRFSQSLALAILVIAWLGLSRFVYGGQPLTGLAAMAIHTALAFAILGVGVLAVSEPVGLVGLLANQGMGGSSVRRLLPAAALLPLLLAWLPQAAAHAGWVGRESALALFALTMALILGVLVCVHALRLDRSDRQRQGALEDLSRSEERTRLIVEGALDAVVTADQQGNITGWNSHAEVLFGWTRAEALGRSLAQTIIPPRHAEAHGQGMRRFLATGASTVLNRRVELTALRRNGEEFPMEISITPIQTSAGVAFSAFVRDITKRRQAMAALHESELRFRTLAESLPHLVWTCRPDGWCDYLSRQWVEYTGQPEAEQLGYGWAENLHPEDRERARGEWAAATARGTQFDIEFRIRRHDGMYRWFKTRAVPLRDTTDSIVKWFGSNTDIDDYKSTQRRLHLQIEQLHLLDQSTRAIGARQDLESIFTAVLGSLENGLTVDFGCICKYDPVDQSLVLVSIGAASRSHAAALGLAEGSRIELESRYLARSVISGQLVHEPDLTRSTAAFPSRLREAGLGALVLAPIAVESKVFGLLVAARRAPGDFSSGDCEFLRQLSEHVGLAAQQADLYTSLQAAYEDLRRSQRAVMQQERLRVIGQMASGIAHDINNALSPAAIYLQSLLERETSLSAEARDRLQVVEQAIGSVARTIGRLREFYRDQDPRQSHEAINPNAEIEQAIELTRARWQGMPMQRGAVINLVAQLAADVPRMVASHGEIRDAMTNLIINAVDAMPRGGQLTIRSSVRGAADAGAQGRPEIEIRVIDTGVGMSAEALSHCLEPFYTTKGERGTGLGLAMVYGMVERHRGRVEVESEPGRGTTVRLLFPFSPAAAAVPAAAPVAAATQLDILLVDDDLVLLNSLHEILKSDGHRVVTADGGQAGIDALHAAQARGASYSLLITDLGMPHVDGHKVAAAAKSLARPIPVLLLTGWGQHLLAEAQLPQHVDKILSKPPRLAELRAALAALAG